VQSCPIDYARRYPWIVEAALKNRHRQFVIDGEAVVLGVDGIADITVSAVRLLPCCIFLRALGASLHPHPAVPRTTSQTRSAPCTLRIA
jgi:hypothetical protein